MWTQKLSVITLMTNEHKKYKKEESKTNKCKITYSVYIYIFIYLKPELEYNV